MSNPHKNKNKNRTDTSTRTNDEGEKKTIITENKNDTGFPTPDEVKKNGEGAVQNIISIGINIGAQNTIYSIFSKVNNKSFITQVLLSDVASRVIPSILVYTDDHRLYGETAKASMKRFSESTYINLSRLIGFNPKCNFYLKEFGEDKNIKYSYLGTPLKDNNILNGKFKGYIDKITKQDNKENLAQEVNPKNYEEVTSDIILADFLSLLNDFYFKQQAINYNVITLSIPDYFTIYQREKMKIILESIHKDKKVNVITESTAITLYYGYTKYRDMFIKGKIGVDQLIKKNIIFIDIGHSKTTFIFSSFKFNEFKVLYVECLPYLGGRNIDFIILDKILEDYNKNEEVKEELEKLGKDKFIPDSKLLLRILESIEKGRKALTVNKDTTILVESLFADIDLEYKLKKEDFEKLIKDEFLNKFEYAFKSFYKTIINNKYTIDNIEMCGELIRIPILQSIVKKVSGMEISKKILIDECPSVGAALYGNYKYGNFPINTFKTLYEYNNFYPLKININTEPKNDELNKNIKDYYKEIGNNQFYVKIPNYQKMKSIIITKEFDNNNNNNKLIKDFIENLVFYKCEIKKLNELKLKDKYIYLLFQKYNKKIKFLGIYNEKKQQISFDKKLIIESRIELKNDNKDEKKQIDEVLIKHNKKDEKYINFVSSKNKVSIELYKYKTDI